MRWGIRIQLESGQRSDDEIEPPVWRLWFQSPVAAESKWLAPPCQHVLTPWDFDGISVRLPFAFSSA